MNTSTTYTLAHTVQCKLKLAANRPDRNLRFVLGHAFTLDNLMLRIVEIENQSAKSVFHEAETGYAGGDEHYDCTASKPAPKPDPHYDCTAAQPEPTPAEPHNDGRGRRISFQDNNARPSNIGGLGTTGVASNNSPKHGPSSPARQRSPPPVAIPKHKYEEEDDDTSSDDYDEPDEYIFGNKASNSKSKPEPQSNKTEEEQEDYEDEEPDPLADNFAGFSLTRFESASAQPPRRRPSPPPPARSPSPLDESRSSDEDEDDDGPVTPPQLPADLDLHELIGGTKDEDLEDLYESVRGCGCHGYRDHEDVGGRAVGAWDIPTEKTDGKHLAVIALAA
jgi:hypothetical protein